MTQSTIQMVNETGLDFRLHLNEGLESLATDFAGPLAPVEYVPYSTWLDTSTPSEPVMKRRNSGNTGWVTEVATADKIDYTRGVPEATPQKLNVALDNLFAKMDHQDIHLQDYFSGVLAPSADITSSLQAAINAARARVVSSGGCATVRIPAGYFFNLSATIVIPSGVFIEGNGSVQTYLRRTGDYGHTFVVGTANPATNVQCAGIRNMCIYHDHGSGPVPPLAAESWVNPVASNSAHIVAYTPVHCDFSGLSLYSLRGSLVIQGGSFSRVYDVDTYGTWDENYTAMQESALGLLIDQDTAVTGSIPTWHLIQFCRFGGTTRPNTTLNYWGDKTKTDTKNIGPRNGLVIQGGEAIYVDNSYTGACNSNGILLSSKGGSILAGVFISNHFFDPCGIKYEDACLRFENRDAGGIIDGVTVSNAQFKGQTNGWRAVSDYGSTATNGSVKDFIIDGHASIFVGNPLELTNMRRATINMNIAAYNYQNWYLADQACAVHVGSSCSVVRVGGIIGGGVYGEVAAGANNRCIDGVRADSWLESRVEVTSTNGGLSGELFVGPPAKSALALNTTNWTVTPRVSSSNIFHIQTLTDNVTATLSTTNAVDGDEITITRTSGGAFNMAVVGYSTRNLSTNTWVTFSFVVGVGWVQKAYGTI